MYEFVHEYPVTLVVIIGLAFVFLGLVLRY